MESGEPSLLDKYYSPSHIVTWWKFETQEKITQMKVLLLGITGLGIEVAKNLVMMQIGEVCLYDETLVSMQDIGRNNCLNQNHIGKFTRAQASLKYLQSLNPNCNVRITNNKSVNYIKNYFHCVVVIDEYDKTYLTKLNQECRQNGVGFIMGGCLGLYGFTFVDFGNQHRIDDLNGQEPNYMHIDNITREEHGFVGLHDGRKVNLSVGDTVEFQQVQGMKEINGRRYQIQELVTVGYRDGFTIGNTMNFSEYKNGGIATQIKVPFIMPFKSLSQSLESPYGIGEPFMPMTSFGVLDLPEQLHATLLALYEFYSKYKRLPRLLNEEDAQELLQLARQSNVSGLRSMKDGCEGFDPRDIDENVVLNTARYAETKILPVCMFWGGIIAQEVVKYTGQYTPLKQWLHHQFFSCLPSETNISRTLKTQSRYDDYVVLFGDEFVKKCSESKALLVGANEIGNEMIKILGSIGMSRKQKSSIYVTDNSRIKLKDTHSHSLFGKQDLGCKKSQILCKKGSKISASNLVYIKDEIKYQTEEIYNDEFWDSVDFVISGTNLLKQNSYLDNQCVWYEKAFFVCSAKGLMSYSESILPFKTQSYSDVERQVQYSVDRSTLANFIFEHKHTIQWAKEIFQNCFLEQSQLLKYFYDNRAGLMEELSRNLYSRHKKLKSIRKYLRVNQLKSYEYCLQIVLGVFNKHFENHIASLLHNFPPDHLADYSGKPFWSGLKRCPQVIYFDVQNPIHFQFAKAGAEILAKMFNLPSPNNQTELKILIRQIYQKLPKQQIFQKTQKIRKQEQDAAQIEDLIQKHLIKQLLDLQLDPQQRPNFIQQLDLYDLKNWHLEFIHAAANLRANNYRLGEIDRFTVRKKLNRVPEKVITTVSMIAGSMGIEIIKYLLNKPMESFRNMNGSLAIGMITQSELLPPTLNTDKQFDPVMCGPVKVVPKQFSKWEKIQILQPMLLCDLIDYFKKTYEIEITMVSMGQNTLYAVWTDKFRNNRRLTMPLQDVIAEVSKEQVYRWKKTVELYIGGEKDGVDYLVPAVKYHFAPKKCLLISKE